MNKLIKILGISVGIIFAATLILAIFQICPPSDLWPIPPWCKSEMQLPEDKIPTFPLISTSSYTLNFNVKVPENTPNHSVIYLEILGENGEGKGSIRMEKTGRNTWSLKENSDKYKNME